MAKSKNLSNEEILGILFREDSDEEVSVSDFEEVDIVEPPIANEVLGNSEVITNFSVFENNRISSEEEEVEVNEVRRIQRKKKLTKDRLVNDVDSSLSPENYDAVELPSSRYGVVIQKKTKTMSENKIVWTSVQPDKRQPGRQGSENIIRHASGPNFFSRASSTPLEAWELFISDDMLNSVVLHTNKKIDSKNQGLSQVQYPNHSTDVAEIRAFIGLRYARGLLGRNHQFFRLLFQDPDGHNIFGATMSVSRFQFLNTMITFDDASTRSQRFPYDRFAAFRTFFEKFNDNCSRSLNPDGYLCIDETLYSCRISIGFKQYNPSKPNRYGLLFKSVNSVRFPYTHRTVVYAGKPIANEGPYYVPGILPIVQSLVTGLSNQMCLQGNNISMDRLYTSLPLVNWLLDKKITAVGTIMANKKGVPAEVKQVAQRDNFSYTVHWQENDPRISLHSYVVPTKSTGKKNVLLLSSHPAIIGVTKDDDKKKPQLLKLYDFTKTGTDVMDQKMSYYSTNSKSRRWTLTSFSYVLDTARLNAQTIFAFNSGTHPRKTDSYKFGMRLVMELITPHLRQRYIKENLRTNIRYKIELLVKDLPKRRPAKRKLCVASASNASKLTPGTALGVTSTANSTTVVSTSSASAPAASTPTVSAPAASALAASVPAASAPAASAPAASALAASVLAASAPAASAPVTPSPVRTVITQASTSGNSCNVSGGTKPRKRCRSCLESARGPNYSAKIMKMSAISTVCNNCQANVCKKHSSILCHNCVQESQ